MTDDIYEDQDPVISTPLPATASEIVTAIAAATDIVTLANTDRIPLYRPLDTILHYTTPPEINNYIWGVYNVKHYGAVGNGVADDTAAINAAFAASGINGGKIYFPAGTYKCTSTINIPRRNYVIHGDGEDSRIQFTQEDGTDGFYYAGFVPTYNHTIFRDMCIIGAGSTKNTGSGIHTYLTTGISIQNVDVRGFGGGAGIWYQGTQISHIIGGDYRLNKYGIRLGPHAPDTLGYGYGLQTCIIGIYNAQCQQNNIVGIYINGSGAPFGNLATTAIRDCVVQGEVRDGVLIYNAEELILENIWFESNNSSSTAGCADIRTSGDCINLLCNNINQGGTPAFIDLSAGTTVSSIKITNCNHLGTIVIGANCLDVKLDNTPLTGLTDSSVNMITQTFQHFRTSAAWTPGFVAAGGKVSVTVDFGSQLMATATVGAAKITTGWVSGTILTVQPGYNNNHSVSVTLINMTGGDVTYPATTVYVDVWSQKLPY